MKNLEGGFDFDTISCTHDCIYCIDHKFAGKMTGKCNNSTSKFFGQPVTDQDFCDKLEEK